MERVRLYVNRIYRKLQIRRGDYFTDTSGNRFRIDNPEALKEDMLELNEDSLKVLEALGRELSDSGISLERLLSN